MYRHLRNIKNTGFTIVELLVVIVVIALLVTLVIVAYNGVQSSARDKSLLADLDTLDGLETRCGLNKPACGIGASVAAKAWYSGTGTDSYLQFTPSSGNVIDVVVNTTDYCMRAYNPSSATYKTLATAATKESTAGACSLYGLGASVAAGGPAQITNMIIDPSVEDGGISPNGPYFSPTLTVDSTTAAYGTKSLEVTTDASNPEGAIWWTGPTASAGTVYTCSISLKGTVGKGLNVSGRAYTTGGAYITEGLGSVAVTLSSSWQRVSVTFTAPATTGMIGIQYVHLTAEAGVNIWGDGAMCTQGTTIYNYADGSSTGWIWNGTVNNSSSTGYPL